MLINYFQIPKIYLDQWDYIESIVLVKSPNKWMVN